MRSRRHDENRPDTVETAPEHFGRTLTWTHPQVARWGNRPHFASVVAGRLAVVDDETSTDDFAAARDLLDDSRRRLREVPAETVITNHVMGLYELAAIHLSDAQPDLHSAKLAIDAVGCLVEGLGSRLGPETETMAEALSTLRMAFVQVKGA